MRISGVFFAIVIISFFLPFLMVTCNGDELTSATGIQLAIGAKEKSDAKSDSAEKAKDDTDAKALKPNIPALTALILAILGLSTALTLKRQHFFIPLAIAGIGIICVLLIYNTVEQDVSKMAGELASFITLAVKRLYGYYLALGAFGAAVISLSIVAFLKKPEPQMGQLSEPLELEAFSVVSRPEDEERIEADADIEEPETGEEAPQESEE